MNRKTHRLSIVLLSCLIVAGVLGVEAVRAEPALQERVELLEAKVKLLEMQIAGMSAFLETLDQQAPPPPPAAAAAEEIPKPSPEQIRAAIAVYLEHSLPISWTGSMLGGKNGRIQEFEIVQMGKYNTQKGYWPVKAHIKGTCDAETLMGSETRAFDRTGDFYISQDDYGKWEASADFL